jgi:hypothetical protein
LKTSGPFTVLPHNDYPIAISIAGHFADARAGKAYVYMPVEVEYPLRKAIHTQQYCFVYVEAFNGMGECEDIARNPKQ